MKKLKVYVNAISDVTNFSDIASKSKYDLTLCSNRYRIDAKSLLGILSLNLSQPIILQYDEIEPEILEEMKKFEVIE